MKGVIHWVSATHHHESEVVLYDRLFTHENPGALDNFCEYINAYSKVISKAYIEHALMDLPLGEIVQFERIGYFKKIKPLNQQSIAFHRVVDLKSSWDKLKKE